MNYADAKKIALETISPRLGEVRYAMDEDNLRSPLEVVGFAGDKVIIQATVGHWTAPIKVRIKEPSAQWQQNVLIGKLQ